MRGKLFRIFLAIFTLQIIGFMIGQAISKKLTKGDEGSDDFQVAAVLGGKQFHSHADHLRRGSAIARMGGLEIDLREAKLDPLGATLELDATMGGMQVLVPESWAVDVERHVQAGEVDVKVTPPEDLPDDAPKLHIEARTRMGGVQVMAKAS